MNTHDIPAEQSSSTQMKKKGAWGHIFTEKFQKAKKNTFFKQLPESITDAITIKHIPFKEEGEEIVIFLCT